MNPEAENDPRDDHELTADANCGDETAFTALYYRYHLWVAGTAYRITGDYHLSLDVVQDTFCYLARKFPGFTLTCQMKTFLYRSVHGFAQSARRKAGRFDTRGLDPETVDQRLPDPAASELADDILSEALAGLTPLHSEIVFLHYADELTLEEIASTLDIPLGTVKSRLHHARKILRQNETLKKIYFK